MGSGAETLSAVQQLQVGGGDGKALHKPEFGGTQHAQPSPLVVCARQLGGLADVLEEEQKEIQEVRAEDFWLLEREGLAEGVEFDAKDATASQGVALLKPEMSDEHAYLNSCCKDFFRHLLVQKQQAQRQDSEGEPELKNRRAIAEKSFKFEGGKRIPDVQVCDEEEKSQVVEQQPSAEFSAHFKAPVLVYETLSPGNYSGKQQLDEEKYLRKRRQLLESKTLLMLIERVDYEQEAESDHFLRVWSRESAQSSFPVEPVKYTNEQAINDEHVWCGPVKAYVPVKAFLSSAQAESFALSFDNALHQEKRKRQEAEQEREAEKRQREEERVQEREDQRKKLQMARLIPENTTRDQAETVLRERFPDDKRVVDEVLVDVFGQNNPGESESA